MFTVDGAFKAAPAHVDELRRGFWPSEEANASLVTPLSATEKEWSAAREDPNDKGPIKTADGINSCVCAKRILT